MRRALFSAVIAALVTLPALALAQNTAPNPALAERGEYLARAGDCAACHTAPGGGAPYAGGYAISSPLGDIVSTNITPSKTHGIGNYSLADFTRAVRDGVTPGGVRLYPAMPYTAYRGISDEDMAALYAYFMLEVAPADTAPAETKLPFPFNIRSLMIGWNLLLHNAPAASPKDVPAVVQRGQYLVETLGHCGSCHTPRNALMAEDRSRSLSGGTVDGWYAPNITSDPVAGIGGWSNQEIASFLKDGSVPDKGGAAGSMAEAVEHSLRYLKDEDLLAIAAYLKTVPVTGASEAPPPAYGWDKARPVQITAIEPGNGSSETDLVQANTLDGAVLFTSACASCHGVNGAGTQDHFYPSLTANTTVGSKNAANLVMTIVEGVSRQGANGHAFMPAFGQELSNAQIAAVANYAIQRFGNPAVTVDEATVARLRAGGEKPLLLAAAPYLFVGGIILALVILAALIAWLVRPRRTVGAN